MEDINLKIIRVIIFKLTNKGKWKEKAIGKLICEQDRDKHIFQFNIFSMQNENKKILEHVISNSIDYTQNGQNIIEWSEIINQNFIEFSVSFLKKKDKRKVWNWIGLIQKSISDKLFYNIVEQLYIGLFSNKTLFLKNNPNPKFKNLDSLKKKIEFKTITVGIYILNSINENWTQNLYKIFLKNQDLEHFKHGIIFSEIFVILLKSEEKSFLEKNISIQNVYRTIHFLEYIENQKKKQNVQIKIRKLIFNSSRLTVSIFTFPNSIKQRVDRLYQFLFFRDVVLLNFLHEFSLHFINIEINKLNLFVIENILKHKMLLNKITRTMYKLIVNKLQKDENKLILIISFIRELLIRIKILPIHIRIRLYNTILQHRILELLYHSIQPYKVIYPYHPIFIRFVIESFTYIFQTNSISTIKEFIRKQENSESRPTLISLLIWMLWKKLDNGLIHQINHLLSCIFICDYSTRSENLRLIRLRPTNEVTFIWQAFHEKYIFLIIDLLEFHLYDERKKLQQDLVRHFVVNILYQAITEHPNCMKHSLMKYDTFKKIANMIIIPDKPNQQILNLELLLSCLRFFRAVVEDDFLMKRVLDQNILDSCVKLYIYNGRKINLLNSTFLSIFGQHNEERFLNTKLTNYISDRYLSDLLTIDTVIFKILKNKYNSYCKMKKDFNDGYLEKYINEQRRNILNKKQISNITEKTLKLPNRTKDEDNEENLFFSKSILSSTSRNFLRNPKNRSDTFLDVGNKSLDLINLKMKTFTFNFKKK